MEIKTKSRGGCCRLRLIGADGDASQKTSFPSCHHRHHQCHALHDDSSHHGPKSGRRPFKKSAFGGEKIAACGSPSLTLPKGRECQFGELRIVIGEMMGGDGVIELRSGDNAVNGGACGRVSMFFTSVCFNY